MENDLNNSDLCPADQKKILRKKSLLKRQSLDKAYLEEQDKAITRLVSAKISKLKVDSVFLFFSFKKEPDLFELPSALPAIKYSYPVIGQEGGDMEFYEWQEGQTSSQNKWGIEEPLIDQDSIPSIPDGQTLIIVPSVCLDRYGYRLGYGGGYYDRFLNAYPESKTLGVCGSDFLFESVPGESWDQQLNLICTEKELIIP